MVENYEFIEVIGLTFFEVEPFLDLLEFNVIRPQKFHNYHKIWGIDDFSSNKAILLFLKAILLKSKYDYFSRK